MFRCPKAKSSRPHSLNEYQERAVIRSITSGRVNTAVEAQKYLEERQNVHVSAQTVRNMLKRKGLKSAVKKKKPFLKSQHIKDRLEFAKRYKDWTIEDWRCVIFSDETKINRFGSDGRKWYWKKAGSSLQSNHIVPTMKYGGGSLMVWGCITAKGIGYLGSIETIMSTAIYCDILDEYLLSTIEWYKYNKKKIIFQHNNDPKHTAKNTIKWLKDKKIRVLDWPSQSPDLNPIEHLWDYVKRRLSDYENIPCGMNELWERIE